MIGIINYGSGNIHAIANIYHRLNIPHKLMSDPIEFDKAEKLVLPGVGAFDETMKLIKSFGMREILDELVLTKKVPILGVCVGMQILSEGGDEGELSGFGWIKGRAEKIDKTTLIQKTQLPHMGWNNILPETNHALLSGINLEKGFYFLHSYYFKASKPQNVIAKVKYGNTFPCIVNHENVFGVQFHPEKSHSNGEKLFENFANL